MNWKFWAEVSTPHEGCAKIPKIPKQPLGEITESQPTVQETKIPTCHWACAGCDVCGSKGHGNSWF